MGDRLIISDNCEEPGNPLVLDSEAIDAAAQDPLAIGKLMVDQVWVLSDIRFWSSGDTKTGPPDGLLMGA